MENNIIIHKNLSITISGDILFNQHSIGTKFLAARLDGWELEDGACLFIAFKNDSDEIPPTLMAFDPKEGLYYLEIPPRIMRKGGNWHMCVYKKLDWDKETGMASAVEVGKVAKLYIAVTVSDGEGNGITEYDVASAIKTILGCSELAEELNGQSNAARDGAEAAKAAAESAQNAAETAQSNAEAAKNSASNSAVIATEKAEAATNEAMAAAASAQSAAEKATISQAAANKAEGHEEIARELLLRVTKQAENAAASAQSADEKAQQAAEMFATHSIKISTEFGAVGDLPAQGNSQTIYFVPNGGVNENSFDEYVWVGSKGAYEKIGSTAVDLSGYVSKNGSVMTGL